MRAALLALCAFAPFASCASCASPPRTDVDGLIERLADPEDQEAERLLIEGPPELDERLEEALRVTKPDVRLRLRRVQGARANRRLGRVDFLADGLPMSCEPDGSDRCADVEDKAPDPDPALSPDGAWRAEAAAVEGDEEIVLRGPEGAVRRVTHERGRDYDPAWSPDGRRLAIVTERDGDAEIYAVNLENLRVIRLTYSPGPDLSPRWSRDSSTVFFVSQRDGRPQIYRVGRDRTNLQRVSDGTTDDLLR